MRFCVEAGGVRVGVAGSVIVDAAAAGDVVFRIDEGEVRPGLINGHDHLHRNHYPRLGMPPYANAYDWGRDLHARHGAAIARARAVPRREALLIGARRNLLAGVTTVVHHDAWEPDFEHDFPLRVVRVPHVHSLGFDRAGVEAAAADRARGVLDRLAIHLAEGVDHAAADEVRELDRLGLLGDWLLAVHVVGADADGCRRLLASGAALVWCPTSNLHLFGRTCAPSLLDGMDVVIGTDSLLTAAGSMLDELRAARALGLIADARLERAVGDVPARRLGLPPPALEPGARADLVVLRRPLLDAHDSDVALVIVDGRPRVADAEFADIFEITGVPAERLGEKIVAMSGRVGEWGSGGVGEEAGEKAGG